MLFKLVPLAILLFFVPSTLEHGVVTYPWPRPIQFNNCGWADPIINQTNGDRGRWIGADQVDDPGFNCTVSGNDINNKTMEMGNYSIPLMATYRRLSQITINVDLYNPHNGSMSVRACCQAELEMDPDMHVAQGCFNDNKQNITAANSNANEFIRVNSSTGQLDILTDQKPNNQTLSISLTMTFNAALEETGHCTLQWNYRTENRSNETFRSAWDVLAIREDEFAFLTSKNFAGQCLSNDGVATGGSIKFHPCGVGSTTSNQSVIGYPILEGYNAKNATIRFESLGNCIDVYSWSTTPGDYVGHYPCNNGQNQMWLKRAIPPGDTGYVQIVNQYSSLCLSANGNSAIHPLTHETCVNSPSPIPDSQQWLFNITRF